jgi:hypothetical protein
LSEKLEDITELVKKRKYPSEMRRANNKKKNNNV